VTTTDIDYAELAREAAGNWHRFQCFHWYGRPADADRWAVVYTHNRDSGLLDQSNAAAIAKALERFTEGEHPTVIAERHSHWAVGHVDGYAIRVYGLNGRITKAFKVWCDLQERLSDYPVLDESDYSEREYDAALEGIRQQGRRHIIDNPPEDWPNKVFDWLWQHNDRELENRDDQGAYPSEESVREALAELGLLEDDD
jgi:hypothetical protein